MSRAARRIYLSESMPPSSRIGVFIGVHGERWTGNAIASIEQQAIDRVEVVAAINGPFPNALAQVRRWQSTSRHRVTVVENACNLGPLGSWYLNRDLLSTPWVALMHQDDIYLPHHLSELLGAAQRAPEDIVAVFGAMEGVDDAGRKVAAPPMNNRHLDMAPGVVTLPAILRRHPLPTPAVMVRNPQGYVDDLAWYDSGAPDSEWFARLACRGRFHVLDTITMNYRLSSDSESKSTGWYSRAWLWAASLARVIHSDDFKGFLLRLPTDQRAEFATNLIKSIPARYPDAPLFGFLQFSAAQQMCAAWGYEPASLTDSLAAYLSIDDASAAMRNLNGIAGRSAKEGSEDAHAAVATLLGKEPTRGLIEASGRSAYQRHGHLLPPSLQKALFRVYDRMWSRRGAR